MHGIILDENINVEPTDKLLQYTFESHISNQPKFIDDGKSCGSHDSDNILSFKPKLPRQHLVQVSAEQQPCPIEAM